MENKILTTILYFLRRILGYLPALIYGHLFSKYFTKATYRLIGERAAAKKPKQVLDIGTATGQPLYSIIEHFGDAQILGIDIDRNYVPACKKLFENKPNVSIQHMNFYELDKRCPDTKFDLIIFGSSFMLMPDQTKAIQLAKRQLAVDGTIYFLLTLYDGRSRYTAFMEKIKPYLKYLTTIDFGKLTYMSEFEAFLKQHHLKITFKDRCAGNFFLKHFKFYIYEVTP